MNAPITTPRTSRRWHWRLLAFLSVLMLAYFAGPSVLAALGGWLNVGESLHAPVDYVYVLGGGASTRPFQAAAIYRAGFAQHILIPQSLTLDDSNDERAPTEEELIHAVLLRRGVPETAIMHLGGPVASTRDEARELKAFLDEHPEASVAVVTNDFHTRRVRLIFRRMIPGRTDDLHFIATPTDGFGPTNWWKFTDGVLSYVSEYAKLVRDRLN